MEASKKKNEELQEEINCHKNEVNNIKYHLGKVKKSQEEFDELQMRLCKNLIAYCVLLVMRP